MKIVLNLKILSFLMLSLVSSNLTYSASPPSQNTDKETSKLFDDLNIKNFEDTKSFCDHHKRRIEEDKAKLNEIEKKDNTQEYLKLINKQLISLRSFLIIEYEKDHSSSPLTESEEKLLN